ACSGNLRYLRRRQYSRPPRPELGSEYPETVWHNGKQETGTPARYVECLQLYALDLCGKRLEWFVLRGSLASSRKFRQREHRKDREFARSQATTTRPEVHILTFHLNTPMGTADASVSAVPFRSRVFSGERMYNKTR